MPEPILSLTDVHAGYDGVPVVFGVSLEVMPGELVAIVGANGAGKSTTMRAIAGLSHPLQGAIRFEGARHLAAARPPDAGARHQLRARGAAALRQALGREEPRAGRLHGKIRGRGPAPAGRDAGALPGAAGSGAPDRRDPERRRAADAAPSPAGLMSRPKLLMLDEMSLGLMPTLVEKMMETIVAINRSGHHRAAGRADGPGGPRDRPPRLRAPDRAHRSVGRREGAPGLRGDPQGLHGDVAPFCWAAQRPSRMAAPKARRASATTSGAALSFAQRLPAGAATKLFGLR
ncbi:MAG: ATP-binding cassette domain-containing protein [Ignavibacteriales bacterium]|nr:ATP-binding cassette domain-containing protein [Ignavibacteriales bacterium]